MKSNERQQRRQATKDAKKAAKLSARSIRKDNKEISIVKMCEDPAPVEDLTSEEFNDLLLKEFSYDELSMINPAIYSNPSRLEYFMHYKAGRYRTCYEYLIENRSLLQ